MTEKPLATPLRTVLGPAVAKSLAAQLDLVTVGDLVYHFPRRYEERGEHSDIAALAVGEEATVLAQVHSASVRTMRNRPGAILTAVVGDDSGGILTLTFFGKAAGALAWRQKELTVGRWGLFAGTVGEYQGRRQLTHPEYVLLGDEASDDAVAEYAGALIPVYPSTSALKTWQIGKCVRLALDTLGPLPDPMPGRIRGERRLMPLREALREIHMPTSREGLAIARRRLAWDEAFAVQVALVQRKRRAASWPATPRPVSSDGLLAAFDAALPYELTAGQRAVGDQVAADLAEPHPMHRLLQGEVGSGKTVCAVRAMLQVVDAGGQAALLAPTEVLAAQHYRGIGDLLGPLGRAGELDSVEGATRIALVTGSQGAAARRRALDEVASGAAGIVVGTHALLYEGVDFADLGLVVVDEQHRFGVEQRDALRAKADRPPHVLVMTATPIPRTVAMTVFGDLDVASLTELPRGRSPIATHVVPAAEKPAYLDRAWQRLREEVTAGHQAYVVCPRIGDAASVGEDADAGAASAESARRPPMAVAEVEPLLREGPLHDLRIAALHGRLPADEKDAVMRSFAAGKTDVLVATTVVEVGVDVPNATVMIILDADRFGISQLHQLRGRVGRGSAPGLCLLVTEAPAGSPARERLDAVASTLDGFKLAELDLEQRREGDVLGASQSGRRSHLRLLSLLRDAKLIGEAREEAVTLIDTDPDLADHPVLAALVADLVGEERAEYLEKG
ncbi:ATP-dependent DNA helicase RecG [Luedemannella flava]|uniref:Probable DNA 3'-5' helicase RecG n=1 Tax=Luedemannella flava TaxID=349316 RepID=A0ABN2LYW8_9ACTN